MSEADESAAPNPDQRPQAGDPRRRVHLLLVALLALVLATLRILPAFTAVSDDPERVFLGFPYSIEDTLQYADFVAQAKDPGRLFFSNRFSLADEEPRLVILPLYLIGRAAALLGLSVATAWIWAQFLLIVAFVFVLHWFLGAFFATPRVRLGALFFLTLAGGLDGFVVLLGAVWPEAWAVVLKKNLWTVLGWTPWMTTYNPVYLAGWLILLPWLRLLRGALRGKTWQAALAAGLLLPMYLIHAYDAVVAAAATVLVPFWALFVRQDARRALAYARPVGLTLLGLIPILFLARWQAGDPLLAKVTAASHSGLFVSPVLWFIGFGGILLAAFYGCGRLGEDRPRAAVLFGWLVAASALSFSPFYEGRHFLYFVSLPLGILAVYGLRSLWRRFRPGGRWRWVLLIAAGLIFGNSFVRVTVRAFSHPAREDRMYATAAELALADQLAKLPPGGVLASRNTCLWLPHRSGQRAVMGHWFLSWDMNRQVQMFQRLVAPDTAPAERDGLLKRFGARYLFWGPREQALGPKPRLDRVRLLPLQRFGNAFLLEIQIPD